MLIVIWLTALTLVAGAVLWMGVLMILRVLHERRAAQRALDRRGMEAALIAVIQGRRDIDEAFRPYRGRARLVAETLLDFLGIVRGEDRELVVAALRHIGAERTLRARISRGSLAGRLASIEALGAFPGPETQFALIRAASGGPPAVRLAALRSLWQAGGELKVADLFTAVEARELTASGPFADLLNMVVSANPAAGLQELQRPALPLACRVLLIGSLSAAGDYTAIPALEANASAAEAAVRTAAIEALGRLMHPAAEPALRIALTDPAWEVRSAAAGAAGNARLSGMASALAELLGDTVWSVRHQAAAALAKLGPGGIEQLRAAAQTGPDGARRAAAFALSGAG